MFRVKESEEIRGFSLAQRVVQAMLLAALLANLGSGYFGDGRVQFITNQVVSVILVFCLAALWWLSRHHLHSQRSFRQVKMLAHDILASMDRGVVTTNREGVVTSINSAGIALISKFAVQNSIVPDECVGRPIVSISAAEVPLMDVHREIIAKFEVRESALPEEAAVLDRDFNVDRAGRVLRLRVDGHVLKDTEGEAIGCVVHLRDVTERMLLEERMRRMERFLSLATLASGLHHEIKNPLTALSIHIQLLEEHLIGRSQEPAGVPSRVRGSMALNQSFTGLGSPLTPDLDELVGVLKTEVCRLNGVLESFRSFAHLQHLSFQPTDVRAVLENVVRLIRPQAAEQHVQITLLDAAKELPHVPLDGEKFEQAVLNLVINALEAMPEGGTLTVGADVRHLPPSSTFEPRHSKLIVSVKDSGSGIPPEVQKNLFLPYFSTRTTGSGMGLALSEKLIGQHGGHIGYRTGPEGTTFEITVPLEQKGIA